MHVLKFQMWFQKKEEMNMNQNWNFKRDRRFKPKNVCGGGVNIFWNNTVEKITQENLN